MKNLMKEGLMRTFKRCVFAVLVFCSATALLAQEETFQLDPTKSEVDFTLGDVLHTVHGKFQLRRGVLKFDTTTGVASGELVVDASTGDSGSNARDKKMKRDILETDKYPTIEFIPQKVIGKVASGGGSQVELEGIMTLHGQPHPMTLVVPVQRNGDVASADVRFEVPYVKWGLKNPSTLFLRVSDKVDIEVRAVGTLTSRSAVEHASAHGELGDHPQHAAISTQHLP
jgi:polyisoprenoid-binding protein YceI